MKQKKKKRNEKNRKKKKNTVANSIDNHGGEQVGSKDPYTSLTLENATYLSLSVSFNQTHKAHVDLVAFRISISSVSTA